MIIFRLESDAGEGVYSSGATDLLGDGFAKASARHPMPWDDELLCRRVDAEGLSLVRGNLLYGFDSMKQLRTWFYKDEWIVTLYENGVVCSVYDAEIAVSGYTQAVYDRDSEELTLVKVLPLNELLTGDSSMKTCYVCDKDTQWLDPQSRCGECSQLTPEQIRGEEPLERETFNEEITR